MSDKPKKYKVTVAFSLVHTIDVCADSVEEAKQTAWSMFDTKKASLGEGEVISVEEELI